MKKDILACHRLARLIGQGTFLVEALVAISIDGMVCSADVALAQSGKLTPNEAAAFVKELKELPPMPKMVDRLDVAERFTFLDCVEMLAVKGIESISVSTGKGIPQNDNKSPLASFIKSNLSMTYDWNTTLLMGNSWYDHLVKAGRKSCYAERMTTWE